MKKGTVKKTEGKTPAKTVKTAGASTKKKNPTVAECAVLKRKLTMKKDELIRAASDASSGLIDNFRCCVAGGFVLDTARKTLGIRQDGKPPKDVDIFIYKGQSVKDMESYLAKQGYKKYSENEHSAIWWKENEPVLNLVYFNPISPKADFMDKTSVISQFDISASKAAVDSEGAEFDKECVLSMALNKVWLSKKIVDEEHDAGNILFYLSRVAKYCSEKGFSASDDVTELFERLTTLKIVQPEDEKSRERLVNTFTVLYDSTDNFGNFLRKQDAKMLSSVIKGDDFPNAGIQEALTYGANSVKGINTSSFEGFLLKKTENEKSLTHPEIDGHAATNSTDGLSRKKIVDDIGKGWISDRGGLICACNTINLAHALVESGVKIPPTMYSAPLFKSEKAIQDIKTHKEIPEFAIANIANIMCKDMALVAFLERASRNLPVSEEEAAFCRRYAEGMPVEFFLKYGIDPELVADSLEFSTEHEGDEFYNNCFIPAFLAKRIYEAEHSKYPFYTPGTPPINAVNALELMVLALDGEPGKYAEKMLNLCKEKGMKANDCEWTDDIKRAIGFQMEKNIAENQEEETYSPMI